MRFYSSVTFVVMEIALFPLTLAKKMSYLVSIRSLTSVFKLLNFKNSNENAALLRVALYTHDFSLFGFSLLSRTISGI